VSCAAVSSCSGCQCERPSNILDLSSSALALLSMRSSNVLSSAGSGALAASLEGKIAKTAALASPARTPPRGTDGRITTKTETDKAALWAAMQAAKARDEMRRLEAARRYTKRLIPVCDFWWQVLRHATWRKSFRVAIEAASAFATVSDLPGAGSMVDCEALITAFWNSLVIPESLHMPVAFVDEHIRTVFRFYDADLRGKIDYRGLLAAIALFRVPFDDPVTRLVRAWYHAYDADASGGLSPRDFVAVMHTVTTTDMERLEMERHVTAEVVAGLVTRSRARRAATATLPDRMAHWSNAKRLAKRMGPGYLATAVPAGEEPASFLPAMWSPYDTALTAEERSAPRIHIDVILEWMRECTDGGGGWHGVGERLHSYLGQHIAVKSACDPQHAFCNSCPRMPTPCQPGGVCASMSVSTW